MDFALLNGFGPQAFCIQSRKSTKSILLFITGDPFVLSKSHLLTTERLTNHPEPYPPDRIALYQSLTQATLAIPLHDDLYFFRPPPPLASPLSVEFDTSSCTYMLGWHLNNTFTCIWRLPDEATLLLLKSKFS